MLACNAYDAEMLTEPSDLRAAQSGRSGASGSQSGTGANAGSAGASSAGNAGSAGSTATSGAGGSGGNDDGDVTTSGNGGGDAPSIACGDGRVSGDELCDIAIDGERAGACPSECPPIDECVLRELRGSECQAECEMVAAECNDGDGCCPADCSSEDDDDCSSRCGDGVVQAGEGESCEPDSEDEPCPTEEECDDDDACTTDVFTGSADNCSASCSNVVITALDPDDGCCPMGANANTDADCDAECGNDIAEPGEECDGGMGCDSDCLLEATDEQRDCLDRLATDGADADCRQCACLNCTDETFACRDDSNATRRDLCIDLIECALAADCTGDACYCGSDCVAPNGPCIEETEAAAESTNPLVILARNGDTSYALGRAIQLGDCAVVQCASVCP